MIATFMLATRQLDPAALGFKFELQIQASSSSLKTEHKNQQCAQCNRTTPALPPDIRSVARHGCCCLRHSAGSAAAPVCAACWPLPAGRKRTPARSAAPAAYPLVQRSDAGMADQCAPRPCGTE